MRDGTWARAPAEWTKRAAWIIGSKAGLSWTGTCWGHPLLPPFDEDHVWELQIADERLPHTAVGHPHIPSEFSQPRQAAYALFSAVEADPLRAASDTLHSAAGAYGRDDYRTLLDEIRLMLPATP